jgi:hypothetical protein
VRRNHPQLVLRFSGEDAFRTRPDELFHVYDVVAPLVHRLGLPDTVGVATPALVAERVAALRARYPGNALEGHFHDDRGLSLINALTAVKSGVKPHQHHRLRHRRALGHYLAHGPAVQSPIDRDYDKLEGYTLRGSYPLNVMVADKLKMLVAAPGARQPDQPHPHRRRAPERHAARGRRLRRPTRWISSA